MKFQVGQIIFIVLKKKQQVLPARVIEEIQKKTLQGEETSYSVEVPVREELQVVSLSQLDCDLFTTLSDVRSFLLNNATSVIDKLLSKAERASKKRFPPVVFDEAVQTSIDSKVQVTLENGSVANVNLPEGM